MNKGKERVVHPKYYNSHPSGVECIELIRHYTCDIANAMKYLWRSGLKGEEGLSMREKEVEDCRKAVWYLEDWLHHPLKGRSITVFTKHPSGVASDIIASCYCKEIALAFQDLWWVGLVINGSVVNVIGEKDRVKQAIGCIQRHIENIESA